MNNFTYSIPTKIHFGKGQISHLSELSESGNKVLLCYGGGSIKKAGIYDEAVKILKEEDMEIFELSGIAPNPKIESVREGVNLCKENSIDMVLDGKFDAEEKEKNRRLLGSSNQRILCLTDRYKDDISWFDINKNGKAVEVNLSDRIVFNGDKI